MLRRRRELTRLIVYAIVIGSILMFVSDWIAFNQSESSCQIFCEIATEMTPMSTRKLWDVKELQVARHESIFAMIGPNHDSGSERQSNEGRKLRLNDEAEFDDYDVIDDDNGKSL